MLVTPAMNESIEKEFLSNAASEWAAVQGTGAYYVNATRQVVQVSGPDSEKLLQQLTCNDVKALPLGQVQWNALLDRKAMMLAPFRLLRQSEQAFLLLFEVPLADFVIDHLTQRRFILKVDIADATAKWALLSVVGAECLERIHEATGVFGDMLQPQKILIPPDRSAWHLWLEKRWTTPWVNLLLPRNEFAEAIALFEAVECVPIGEGTLARVRWQDSIPEWGVELDETRMVLEANWHDATSRSKGCYPGQEVVERISSYGQGKIPRQFMVLPLADTETSFPPLPCPLKNGEGKAVGQAVRILPAVNDGPALVGVYVETKYGNDLGEVISEDESFTLIG